MIADDILNYECIGEVREASERVGFQVVTLDGRKGPLASSISRYSLLLSYLPYYPITPFLYAQSYRPILSYMFPSHAHFYALISFICISPSYLMVGMEYPHNQILGQVNRLSIQFLPSLSLSLSLFVFILTFYI